MRNPHNFYIVFLCTCKLSLALFFAQSVDAAHSVSEWVVYSNPGIDAVSQESDTPIRGTHIAAVEPDMRTIQEGIPLEEFDKYSFGWRDYYYLAQTVSCERFRNKHLHVSAYLKLDTNRADKSLKYYRKKVEQKLLFYRQKNQFNQHQKLWEAYTFGGLKHIRTKTDVKIIVFVTRNSGINQFETTYNYEKNSTEWQRLNSEAEVSSDCISITIAIWSRGFGDLYVDHVVVAEQGGKLVAPKPFPFLIGYDSSLGEMLKLWALRSKEKKSFANLSFEDSAH